MSLISELKRRNVIRVGVAYLIAVWLLLQIVDVLVPLLTLPDWVGRFVFLILLIGLVPALIFSWAYEMTPDGLKPEAEVEHDESASRHTARKLNRLTIGLLIVVAAIVIADRLIPESNESVPDVTAEAVPAVAEPARPADARPSVAVMPFVNMSDDEANEYFSDGISEELLNSLVGIRNLRVPSRTSSFTFKGSDKKLDEIGRELNVEHVLEGSVRKAGKTVRVTAQLIEAATDTHVWSATYTRDLDDIFAVQDEIAGAIVDALKLTLTGEEIKQLGSHGTDNIEAYNKYLVARYQWNQRTIESLNSAVENLRDAVSLDPDFGQAWASLADTYVILPEYGAATVEESRALTKEALAKALAINPDSAQALTASGAMRAQFEFDWEGGLAELERVVANSPNYATGHQFYGEILAMLGRVDEALEQLAIARELDPLSVIIRHVPGYILLWNGRLDEAEQHFLDALEVGGIHWTFYNLDVLKTLKGEYDEARYYARKHAEARGFDPAADLARIDAVENPALKARALQLIRERQDMEDGVFGKAIQYVLLDEYDLALDSLEAGAESGDPYAPGVNYVILFDPLRDNPRFQALLRKVNLPL